MIACAHFNHRTGCRDCSRSPGTLGCQTWASKYRKGDGKDYLCKWCGIRKDALAEKALHEASCASTITWTRAQTPAAQPQLALAPPSASSSNPPIEAPYARCDTLRDHVFAIEAKLVVLEERLKQLEDRYFVQ